MENKENLSTLKLYSPLYAQYFLLEKSNGSKDGYDANEPLDLWGEDLTDQTENIRQAIQSDFTLNKTPRGLMEYYHGSPSVDEKVFSLHPTVEERDGALYGVAVCRIKGALTADELAEVKSYCTGQYADGWGESFEQHPLMSDKGELYVSFWQSTDFFIKIETEMGYPKRQRGTIVKQVNIDTF